VRDLFGLGKLFRKENRAFFIRDGVNTYKVAWTDWSAEKAINLGYSKSAVVYASIEKRAKLLAAIPFTVETLNSKGEWETSPNHHIQTLLNKPNPYQSFYELLYLVSQQLDLTGNAFLREVKVKSAIEGEITKELYLLESANVQIIEGKTKLIEKYIYQAGNKKIEYDESEIVQLMYPNPSSQTSGMPILKGAGIAVDIDRETSEWQKVSLSNRSLADIYVKVDESTTPEQMNFIKEQLKQNYQGPKNARKPIVTTGEITNFGQNAAELDFTNSKKANWIEICAAFGISLANLGMTENVNLANAEAMNKQLYQDTIIPLAALYEIQLTSQLCGDGVRIRADYSNLSALQENLDKKLERAQKLFNMGVPFNVINQKLELGFEDIDGGDTGYLPSSLIPAGISFEEDEKSAEAADGKKN
jgi:HK97 family phage portal protein